MIGADTLTYQTLDDLRHTILGGHGVAFKNLDDSCFSGVYCTPGVTQEYLSSIKR